MCNHGRPFILAMLALTACIRSRLPVISRNILRTVARPSILQVTMTLRKTSKTSLASVAGKESKKAKTRSLVTAAAESLEKDETVVTDIVESTLTPEMKEGAFENFEIIKKTVKKLEERGINYLFPIQAATFNQIWDGIDIIAQARTGTGKTLSFALPVCEKLRSLDNDRGIGRPPLVLTLAPTRELAIQISKEFDLIKSKKLSSACFYGGSSYDPQENAIRKGMDILVGTPGRIIDHLNKGRLDLSKVKYVILDEADRMMDMGFQEPVEQILSNAYVEGNKPQTLLFSATLPKWVQRTAKKYMNDSLQIIDLIGSDQGRAATTVEHKAIRCPYHERASTIGDIVQVYGGIQGRTMIFTSTKKEANELALNAVIKQETQVLHGDIQQAQREITLKSFREGKVRCLVATDVAARGLDIPEVDLVVQCEPPKDVEAYIHRSGRTGRAGRKGVCVVFYKPQQEYMLGAVEDKAGLKFTRIGAPQVSEIIAASANDAAKSLETVCPKVLPHFYTAADNLIQTLGARDSLAAALAFLSGNAEMKTRSLLSSQQGWVTFLIKLNREIYGIRAVYQTLNFNFDAEVVSEIKGVRFCKDKMSAVFDVPEKYSEMLMEKWNDNYATLEIPTALPELSQLARSNDSYNGGQQNRSYGYNNNYSNNSYGGGRNSYGNNSYGSQRNNSYGNNNGYNRNQSQGGFKRKFENSTSSQNNYKRTRY